MSSYLVITILAVAFVGIRIGECTSKTSEKILCPENQIYASCVHPCNNCRDRGVCSFTQKCTAGCDCKKGYYKNAEGHCVLEEFCDCHAVGRCFPDEEFLQCGCVLTCCNARQYNPCASQCLKGCFCRDGRVRDKVGRCVNLEDCPPQTTPSPVTCGPNAHYERCASACQPTCCKPNPTCRSKCKPGCVCNDGYILFSDICIKKDRCPTKKCGPFEKFSECVIPCNDCNYRGNCNFKKCNEGCDCIEGYYRDKNDKCIPEEKCPPNVDECDEDEEYYDHKPDCKNTCDNFDDPAVICPVGEPGCFCKDGLVQKKDGKCISPNECPDKECGINEEFKSCGFCDPTCEMNPPICPHYCKRVCLCKKGFVRSKTGECIPENECPPIECNADEIYYDHKPDCRNTCDNFDDPAVNCPVGDPGCFCNYDLVQRKDGKCIPPNECPDKECGINEEFKSCGFCDPTCERNPPICPHYCKRVCLCLKGYVRSKTGECIPENECPPRCGQNEEIVECVIPAWCNTCTDRRKSCKKGTCVQGCDCKPNHYRDHDGICIPEYECPNCTQFCGNGCYMNYTTVPCPTCVCPTSTTPPVECGPGRIFTHCGDYCPETCETLGQNLTCPDCERTCICKPPTVLNEFGQCVHRNECDTNCYLPVCDANCVVDYTTQRCPICNCTLPVLPKCGPVYCSGDCSYDNDTQACPTCTCNYTGDSTCRVICPPGDRLDFGSNFCPTCQPIIFTSTAPQRNCEKDKVYTDCIDYCTSTCEAYIGLYPLNCKIIYCKNGCSCIEGKALTRDGRCVAVKDCTSADVCTAEEEFRKCGSTYPPTCSNPTGICKKACMFACFCKNGLVRASNGSCVSQEDCEVFCGPNEKYDSCGTACPETCDNYGQGETCTESCVTGCFCKPPLVRDENWQCIHPDKCPIVSNCTLPTCVQGCTIDYTSQPCPTCDCTTPPPTESPCGLPTEIYKSCGTACPKTCENYDKNETCTNEHCVSGCFCKPPLVRDENGECIDPEECNKVTTQCYISTCDPGCTVDYNLKPCPRCTCTTTAPTTVSTPEPPIKCPKDKKYSKCFPWCPRTCEYFVGVNSLSCRYKCYEACSCKDTYGAMTRDGKCIHRDNCTLADVCTREETLGTCEKGCPRTCSNPTGTCTKPCIIGCFCKNEFVRADNGRCIPPEECKEHCPRNEVFKLCGTACQRTCDNYGKHIKCISKCVTGCFCKSGLVRNKDGKCVRPNRCKQRRKCGKHEVFKKCGTTCPASCLEPNPFFCPNFCVRGCFCEDGYLRTDKGKCVLPERCPLTPQKCPKRQEYYDCKPTCRHTCPNRNDPPTKCMKICARGCFCRQGLVMNTNGKCIPPKKCPNVCGKDEQYYDHMPNCKNNCGPYSDPGVRCALGPPGCFCKEGLIKRGDGECVKPEDC